MEHEPTVYIAAKSFEVLFITLASQGADDQGLSLTTGKQRRTMGAGQNADFAADGPDIFEGATIKP
jgi:hypothetical protein